MVVLIFGKIKTADEAANRAVFRVNGHQRGLYLWHLRNTEHALVVLRNPQHRATAQTIAGCGGVRQRIAGEADGLAFQGEGFALAPRDDHALGVSLQHHGGQQIVAVRVLRKRAVDGLGGRLFRFFAFFARSRQVNIAFRATKRLPALIIKHAAPQRLIRRLLIARLDRGGDRQAACVGGFADQIKRELPRHFVQIFRMHGRAAGLAQC